MHVYRMKYRIKQHIGFKFRYPVHLTEDAIGKNKANGRCDRTDKVSVNVLVMAKDKKKNKKVTAGDLFGKLGKRGRDNSESADELKDEISFIDDGADNSIDVSGAQNNSDSDLDINEACCANICPTTTLTKTATFPRKRNLWRVRAVFSRV